MQYPGLAGHDARLAQALAALLQQGGHVDAAPNSVEALLEAAGHALAPGAARAAAPAPGKWDPDAIENAEWASIHRALTQARDYLCKDGTRHTWLDGDIAMAAERAKAPRRHIPTVDPVTKGWLATLSSAFHQARRGEHDHDAEKLREILHYFARADRSPVAYPPEVTQALAVAGRALDMLAAGASFNQVVEQTGVTAAVTLAKASAQAAVEAAADARSPVVVLRMNAGTVLAVDSSHAADVVVLDADIYGSEIPDLTDVGGELYRVTERAANARLDTEGAGAGFVSDVLAHLGEAEGARIAALETEEEADAPRA